MYFIEFNKKYSYDVAGLRVKSRPVIPTTEKQINPVPISGGQTLYEDLEEYNDIDIPVEFNFVDKIRQIKRKEREINSWLNNIEDNKLSFSDDSNYFYKVNKVTVGEYTTKLRQLVSFTSTFTCEPYQYTKEGSRARDITPVLYNPSWLYSKPIFLLEGEGLITLTVNENSVTLNVGQSIEVDVDRELIYRAGNIENERKTGSWKDLRLLPRENKIGYTLASGAKLTSFKIIPNWREI